MFFGQLEKIIKEQGTPIFDFKSALKSKIGT
jgi:hypothetical protein